MKPIPKTDLSGIPFYIFISFLMGMFGFWGVQNFWDANLPGMAAVCAALFLTHIGLYWASFKFFDTPRWFFIFYPAQTALMLAIALMPYPNDDLGLTVLGSAVISMVGSSFGLWGNTRRSLWIGLFYFGMMLLLIFFLTQPSQFLAVASGTLFNGGLVVLFMVVLNQQIYEKQRAQELAESLESANARLAAFAIKNETLTLQNERQRVARELHDTLAQGVAGLVLQLEAVRMHLREGRAERAAAIVDQALGRARSTLADSRAAIDDLRVNPHPNLASAARETVSRFEQTSGLPCQLQTNLNEDFQCSPQVSDHTLQILNEALANIARHACARQVAVRLDGNGEHFTLEIHDDGQGFNPAQIPATGHYGLLGMKERARLCGGILTIESGPSLGTTVRLTIAPGESA